MSSQRNYRRLCIVHATVTPTVVGHVHIIEHIAYPNWFFQLRSWSALTSSGQHFELYPKLFFYNACYRITRLTVALSPRDAWASNVTSDFKQFACSRKVAKTLIIRRNATVVRLSAREIDIYSKLKILNILTWSWASTIVRVFLWAVVSLLVIDGFALLRNLNLK